MLILKNKTSWYFALSVAAFVFVAIPHNVLAGSAVLSWNANTEPDLAGYKVYYGNSARTCNHPDANRCGYSTVVDVHNVTSYLLNDLTNGQTYYFSITAYDTSGNESDFSNEVSKLITAHIPGDLDNNNRVDIFDYNIFVPNFGNTSCGNLADIDGNCRVDIFDYNILLTNFGRTS